MSLIYCIENTLNSKRYVGKTTCSLEERWRGHINDCRNKRTEKRPLHNAIRKYGASSFIIYLLQECNIEDENKYEKLWIQGLNTYKEGYNATLGGEGSSKLNEELICEYYYKFNNMQQVAQELGYHVDSVRKILKKNNINTKSSQLIAKEKNSVKVIQYDLNMNYIQTHNSMTNAARSLNKPDSFSNKISRACRGLNKTALKYIWRFG